MSGSRFLWAVGSGFLTGVASASLFAVGYAEVLFAILVALGALTYIAIDKKKMAALALVAIASFSCALGIVRTEAARMSGDPALTSRAGKQTIIAGVIIAEPDARDASTHLTVQAQDLLVGSTSIPIHARVLVLAPPHARVSYGDVIRAEGELQIPAPFETSPGRSFDYPDYLAVSGITYELVRAQVDVAGARHANPLYAGAITIKHAYLDGLAAVLPEPESALAAGITVGDKRSVGQELTQEFQRTSLVHMLVLSGYNITVVANALNRLLNFAPPFAHYGTSIVVIIFFMIASGGASSAVRSGLLAAVAMFARSRSRTVHAGNALTLVALIMVAWNPIILIFDPSFELSMLAAIGLVYVTPLFEPLLARIPERFGIREIVSSTIATQSCVMPYLLYQSGFASIYALPANVLALAFVPAAMAASAVAAVGGMVAGSYALPLALPAYALLRYLLAVTHFFASLPYAVLQIPAFGFSWVAAFYVLLAAVVVIVQTKTPRE